MLVTHTVDTRSMAKGERFDFWHELLAREVAPARVYSDHAGDFRAWARVTDLGELRLTSYRYPSLDMRRTGRSVRQFDPQMYQLALPTAGQSAISQQRRQSELRPAEFTFVDTSRPYDASHRQSPSAPGPASSVTILIPHSRLPLPPDKIDQLLAARLPADTGMGALLATYLRHIADHPEQFRPTDAARLGSTALDLISATLAQQLDLESMLPAEVQREALRARVRAFVDENLGDPELTPRSVAAVHHLSVRSLHRLFEGEQTTVAELIRTRRLERCRQDLRDPRLRGQPAYVIGARWGFPDRAHFSRAFRAAYGLSPQAFRERSTP